MSTKSLQGKFLFYLVSTFLSFLSLVIFALFFASFFLNLARTEILATRLTSNWNFLNSQSKRLYFSDSPVPDLDRQWQEGFRQVEDSRLQLIEFAANLPGNAELVREDVRRINRVWNESQAYLAEISRSLEEVRQSEIGIITQRSGGIALINFTIRYLNGQLSQAQYAPVARLESAIRVLDSAGEIFNTQLADLNQHIVDYRRSVSRNFIITTGSMTALVLLLFVVFLSNVIRLNADMNRRILEQTQELAARLGLLQRTQHELLESRKQSAMVYLVNGIAHEINTPLGNSITVHSYLQDRLQTESLQDESSITDSLDLMRQNLQRIDKLVIALRTFTQPRDSSAQSVEIRLGTLVSTILAEAMLDETVSLDYEAEKSIWTNPALLGQAIAPIMQNWKDLALEHGPVRPEIRYLENNGSWFLSFIDRGPGMSKQVEASCTEPLFTTKRNRGHIGLGLAITSNIVNNLLKGTLIVQSIQGRGTWVVLKFSMDRKESKEV